MVIAQILNILKSFAVRLPAYIEELDARRIAMTHPIKTDNVLFSLNSTQVIKNISITIPSDSEIVGYIVKIINSKNLEQSATIISNYTEQVTGLRKVITCDIGLQQDPVADFSANYTFNITYRLA